jgi:protein-disulfide isomerase
MKKLFRMTLAAILPLALVALGAEKKPEGITRQQADEILEELRAIKDLLRQQLAKGAAPQEPAGPTRAKVNVEGYQMLGSREAPLTMVEYTDYQCPFCQRFHVSAFPELKKNYIDTGKLRFYSKDMPLDFHANAMRAAIAARCAIDQGRFWELRDLMGANPDKLDVVNLVNFAGSLKMNPDQFRECLLTEKYKNAVQTDVMEAMKVGATGTPTFVLGKSTAQGVDGEVMVGAMPFEMFDEKLKALSK